LKDLKGIGKRMPVTTFCVYSAALSMIGFPPFNGFIGKWFLATGALEATQIALSLTGWEPERCCC